MKTKVSSTWLGMLLAGIAFVPWSASADITLTNASGTTLAAALAQGGYIRLVFTYGSNSTGLVFSNVSLGLPAESVVQADTTLDAGSNTVTLFPLLSTGQASFRLFSVAPGLSLTLLNLTLASGSNSVGGAISNAGTLVASNCVFKNNFAGGTSGVNGNNGADSSWGNGKNGGNGGSGAGAVGGAIYNLGTASVAWCQFLTNTVMGGSGGNGGNGGNGGASGGNGGNGGGAGAGQGGAIYSQGVLVVTNSSFTGNYAVGGSGGMGGTNGAGPLFSHSGQGGAGQPGSGAAIYNGGQATVVGACFNGNEAMGGNSQGGGYGSGTGPNGPVGGLGLGGGICNTASLGVTNCTFAFDQALGGNGGNGGSGGFNGGNGGNGGDGWGGGVYSSGAAQVVNCTLSDCTVSGGTNGVGGDGPLWTGHDGTPGGGYGAAVASAGGSLQLLNSILNHSIAGINAYGGVVDAGHNLSSDGTPSFTGVGSLNNTNALLGGLTDNGGPTLTMALQPGSLAIDMADTRACLAFDQRGTNRFGAGADSGAFELAFSGISGHVRTTNGGGMSGVLLTLSNAVGTVTTTTDTNGAYAFSTLPAGDYTIIVSSPTFSYAFNPASYAVTLGLNQTVDFQAVPLFVLGGRVVPVVNPTNGVANVQVSIYASGGDTNTAVGTTTTDAAGYFSIPGLPSGSYVVLPALAGYNFTPAIVLATTGTTTATNLLFQASGIATISGRLVEGGNGLAQILVTAGNLTATTDANGYYTFTQVPPGGYDITPSRSNYVFAPSSSHVNLSASVAGINFVATRAFWLSGQITETSNGLGGVTVAVTNAAFTNQFITNTSSSGAYALWVPAGSNTVVPSFTNYAFNPSSTNLLVTSNLAGANFTGFRAYTITGTVRETAGGVSNILVTVIPPPLPPGTTYTDGSGNFSLTRLPAGAYTVAVSGNGYAFSPPSTNVVAGPTNPPSLAFLASGTNSLGGRILGGGVGLSNVLVTVASPFLAGGKRTAVTDATGAYLLTNLPPHLYAVQPTLAGYFFAPAWAAVNLLNSSNAVNFSGLSSYVLSGQINQNSNPVPNVTVTVSNLMLGTNFVATTDGNGYYALSVPAGTNSVVPTAPGLRFKPLLPMFAVTNVVVGTNFLIPGNPILVTNVVIVPNLILVTSNTYEVNFEAGTGYFIGGQILSGGSGLAQVALTLTSASSSNNVLSDTNGSFLFKWMPAAAYTLSPALAGFMFTPAQTISLVVSDTNFLFSATRAYSISGHLYDAVTSHAIADVDVYCQNLVSTNFDLVTTDTNGFYEIPLLPKGVYAITPDAYGATDYLFEPPYADIPITSGNVTNVNFQGTGLDNLSGRITVGTQGLGGALVTAAGRSALTDANGYYTIPNLPDGTFQVTPSLAHYAFVPAFQQVTMNGDIAGINFAARGVVNLGGHVFDLPGSNGLAGVTVLITNSSSTNVYVTNTDLTGSYSIQVPSGTNTVMASLTGYVFEPSPASLVTTNFVTFTDQTNLNFAGFVPYAISGVVTEPLTGVSNAVVTATTVARTRTVSTDASGHFTLSPLPAGDYLLQVSLGGYAFSPLALNVTLGPTNALGLIFQATGTNQMAGHVTAGGIGVVGVRLTVSHPLLPGGRVAVSTDASGYYAVSNLAPRPDYIVTPSKSQTLFSPAVRTVSLVTNRADVDFLAVSSFTLNGQVTTDGITPIPSVVITVTNGDLSLRLTTTSGADGYYSLTVPAGLNGVSAALTGYYITPGAINLNVTANTSGINFVGTPMYRLGGRITTGTNPLAGVSVLITNTTFGLGYTAQTASNGYYLLSVPAGANTVVPALAGYQFTPVWLPVALTADRTNANFSGARLLYSVSGQLLENNTPVTNFPVSLTGTGLSATAATDAGGNYLFSNVPSQTLTLAPAPGGVGFTPAQVTVALNNNLVTNFLANPVQALILRHSNTNGTGIIYLGTGLPSRPYRLQTSTNLSQRLTNVAGWATALLTNADANGFFRYLDPNPPSSANPFRFYRGTPQ